MISGAGIAGTTLAYWLLKHGFEPTIVEQSPSFRRGGYITDFWGVGFDVAERMNIIPELRSRGYDAKAVRIVDGRGKIVGGFSTNIFKSGLANRFLSITRGDLADVIYEKIENKVEFIFGDCITSLREETKSMLVTFKNAPPRTFDLVIGADGLHSVVRELTFGAEDLFEMHLGYRAAAFSAAGYRPRDEDIYVSYSLPGRQIARFAVRNDRTIFFLIFASDPNAIDIKDATSQKVALQAIFKDGAWETGKILQLLQSCDDLYFDAVSQIRMPTYWSHRVALVGDAAYCPSLLAGQGSALAMAGSYILAGELKKAHGDHVVAFSKYEDMLKPFIVKKQKGAERMGSWFAPKTSLGIFVRNGITRLLNIPLFSNAFVKSSIADKLPLPEY